MSQNRDHYIVYNSTRAACRISTLEDLFNDGLIALAGLLAALSNRKASGGDYAQVWDFGDSSCFTSRFYLNSSFASSTRFPLANPNSNTRCCRKSCRCCITATMCIVTIFNVQGEFQANLHEHERNVQASYVKRLPTVPTVIKKAWPQWFGLITFRAANLVYRQRSHNMYSTGHPAVRCQWYYTLIFSSFSPL